MRNLLLVGWLVLLGKPSFAIQDSVVVDGQRFDYFAEVEVDTTASLTNGLQRDWWLGMGWNVQANSSSGDLSTIGLPARRPTLYLSFQQDFRKARGRGGVYLSHHQPWTIQIDEVSPYIKGWVKSESRWAQVEQILLVPDSLEPERDTLMAPLVIGHAVNLGLAWEGEEVKGWRPRCSAAWTILRPANVLLFAAPPNPEDWNTTAPSETYMTQPWWTSRLRLEAGAVLDWGDPHLAKRTASQFQVQVFYMMPDVWGVQFALHVSPTRR